MITKHPSMYEWDNIQTRSTPIGSKYGVLIIDNRPAKGNMQSTTLLTEIAVNMYLPKLQRQIRNDISIIRMLTANM